MTTQPQPEALHIADECEHSAELWLNEVHSRITAAAALRRLHAECEALRMERDALRAATGGWMGYFDDAARAAKEQSNDERR